MKIISKKILIKLRAYLAIFKGLDCPSEVTLKASLQESIIFCPKENAPPVKSSKILWIFHPIVDFLLKLLTHCGIYLIKLIKTLLQPKYTKELKIYFLSCLTWGS